MITSDTLPNTEVIQCSAQTCPNFRYTYEIGYTTQEAALLCTKAMRRILGESEEIAEDARTNGALCGTYLLQKEAKGYFHKSSDVA